ncbi:MAG TPA: HYR domain-containing protein, partial [Nitrospirota bacterium]|nr:HYR domain-containing protein [Nitrospirota bacterium]
VPPNSPPVADAGPDFAVECSGGKTDAPLDGTASSDPDGDPLIYSWTGDFHPNPAEGPIPAVKLSRGTYTLALTVDDGKGGTATDTVVVDVTDTTAPSADAGPDVTFEATERAGAAYVLPADASDACCLAAVAVSPELAMYPLGTTSVTVTASDCFGNQAEDTADVTVRDTTAPLIAAPADLAVEAEGPRTMPGLGAAEASDIFPFTVTNDAPEDGFGVGTATVAWTALDENGNSATDTQAVTVRDTTAPELSVPPDAEFEATAVETPLSESDYGTATASDLVGVQEVKSDAPATFRLGRTVIAWTAVDTSGNVSSGPQAITVVDTTPPRLDGLDERVFEATSYEGAAADYAVTAADLVDGVCAVLYSAAPGSTFALGRHEVKCSSTDTRGNKAEGILIVVVRDTTPPSITVPTVAPVEAVSYSGAPVHYSAAVTDIADRGPAVSYEPPSGSVFPLGTHKVKVTARDASGNSAESSFMVAVVDTTPPSLPELPDIVAEATSPQGTAVIFSATATDIADPHPAVAFLPQPGGIFPLGDTTVTCTATDASGNTCAPRTFKVTVQDTTPPSFTAMPADLHAVLNAPVELSGLAGFLASFTASDIVDTDVELSFSGAPGSCAAVGVFAVTCTATDDHGNSATCTRNVCVEYKKCVFLQPVSLDKPFKLGSTVPVKFQLTDYYDNVAGGAHVALLAQKYSGSGPADEPIIVSSTSSADTGNLCRYEPPAQHYIYNLSTKGLAAGSWMLIACPDDGTMRTKQVSFKP